MSGDPTHRIFDELSFYRFGFTQPDRLAFYMDDMWISRCLERRGVEKYFIPARTEWELPFSSLIRPYLTRFLGVTTC